MTENQGVQLNFQEVGHIKWIDLCNISQLKKTRLNELCDVSVKIPLLSKDNTKFLEIVLMGGQ